MSQAHMLKTVGRLDAGIAAYRRALAIAPTLGEVWWSLANLTTVRIADADLAAMRHRLALIGYDAGEMSAMVDRMIAALTPDLFARAAFAGCEAPDPSFILGMPRAGSTLIEQLLASHS